MLRTGTRLVLSVRLDSVAEAWVSMAEEAFAALSESIVPRTLRSLLVLPFAVQYTTGDSDDTQGQGADIDAVAKYVVGSDSVSKGQPRPHFNTHASFAR